MANYLTYPFKTMRITQSYTGSYSHNPHSQGSPKDFPWDESGVDAGRDYLYCTCDGLKIKRIYTAGTNTIWVQSTSKVDLPDGTQDYVSGLIIHLNDSDIKNLRVGQVFYRGNKICMEGTDGQATGNHLHLSFGKGKISGNGWIKNNKGKWVLTTVGGACKPEELFYLDKSFTKVVADKGIDFKDLPEQNVTESKKPKKYTTGKYQVDTGLLRVRKGPGTSHPALKFSQLKSTAKVKILAKVKKQADGYVDGMTFTVKKVEGSWGQTASGWVCLDYCKRIK